MSRRARAAATVSSAVVSGAPSGSVAGLAPARADHAGHDGGLEAAGARLVLAHLAREGHDLELLAQADEPPQGEARRAAAPRARRRARAPAARSRRRRCP